MFQNKKNNLIYIIFLLLMLTTISLGVGYAQISGIGLDISGQAVLDRQTGVVISNIEFLSGNGINPSESSINTYYKALLDSTIVLGNDSSSNITYQVTITNLTNEDYYFVNALYDSEFYDNNNITFELANI